MAYKLATGHGIALVSLIDMIPQPRTDVTVQPVVRSYSASGSVHETGLFIELQFSMLDPASQYTTLLAACGLTSALNANVTVYVPNEQYVFTRYNGVIHRPQQGPDIKRLYIIQDVVLLVARLVAL